MPTKLNSDTLHQRIVNPATQTYVDVYKPPKKVVSLFRQFPGLLQSRRSQRLASDYFCKLLHKMRRSARLSSKPGNRLEKDTTF